MTENLFSEKASPKIFLNQSEFIELYQSGAKLTDIARDYGVDRATIRRWAKKLGLIHTQPKEKTFFCDGVAVEPWWISEIVLKLMKEENP